MALWHLIRQTDKTRLHGHDVNKDLLTRFICTRIIRDSKHDLKHDLKHDHQRKLKAEQQ